ncbi:MAG: A/G-specific adenine glycosylase [Crenarchaeota archaeon]|nr:A/G-specific adenine glycosylase [Thermoproteota archaeon]
MSFYKAKNETFSKLNLSLKEANFNSAKMIPLRKEKIDFFTQKIVEWYKIHGDHNLPWRNTKDPWAILVAAFLLRKTTVQQVIKIYEKFLEKYSSPEAILKADVSEIENTIKPLGIERLRSQHLVMLAREVIEKFNGKIPCSKEQLKELPGVGDYIASEVLLASYGKPEPLLDRNMLRIFERVFGIKSTKKRPHTDPLMWEFANTIMPKEPEVAKIFNYGVLDFARKICTIKNPKCKICILKDICLHIKKQS